MATRVNGSKTKAAEGLFAVEVEPGVFVYSLPPSHTLPAATRKMIDEMSARADERISRRWEEVRQRRAARSNGDLGEQAAGALGDEVADATASVVRQASER